MITQVAAAWSGSVSVVREVNLVTCDFTFGSQRIAGGQELFDEEMASMVTTMEQDPTSLSDLVPRSF